MKQTSDLCGARPLNSQGVNSPHAATSGKLRAPPRTNEAQLAEALAAALAAAVDARLDELVAERVAGAAPPAAPAQPDGWLSVAEVAEFVGVSKRTVHRALRAGALVGHRTGGAGLLDEQRARTDVLPRQRRRLARPQPGVRHQAHERRALEVVGGEGRVANGTKTGAIRTVRLLAPLVDDLAAWRSSSARDGGPLFPRRDGTAWTMTDYRNWSPAPV
jgi:excisionase family DNA binding protein